MFLGPWPNFDQEPIENGRFVVLSIRTALTHFFRSVIPGNERKPEGRRVPGGLWTFKGNCGGTKETVVRWNLGIPVGVSLCATCDLNRPSDSLHTTPVSGGSTSIKAQL